MTPTKHTAAVLIPALMMLVWACGNNDGDPPTRALQAAEALPAQPETLSAQPVEDAPASTTENPLPPSSTAGTVATVVEPEPDNTPTAMERPPVSYLEEIIPPCTPIGPNKEDPCEAVLPPRKMTSSTSHFAPMPDPLPTISELIHELTPLSAPHMVVRATGIPNTARCDGLYPVRSADYEPELNKQQVQGYFHYICFVDFMINEYITGEGPPKLTMDMGGGSVPFLNQDDWKTADIRQLKELYEFPESEFYSLLYEGKEFIIMVGVSTNFSVETWTPHGYEYSMWQITRKNDELRAISGSIHLADTPEQHQALNRPLDDVLREIIEAVETRTTVNEGRIGPDPDLPEIITDANNLQDYYKTVGLVYEGENAAVLPPPAPGAEDPKRDPPDGGAATPADDGERPTQSG